MILRFSAFVAAFACLALPLIPGAVAAQNTSLSRLDAGYQARGWEAVGRLDIGSSGFCSGTLIGPDLVLTAAHCVYDKQTGRPYAPKDFTFRAGLRNGAAAAKRGVSKIAAHPGFDPNGRLDASNISHDAALLRLSAPIQTADMNPFALHIDRVSPGPVSVVSYGRGREDAQSRQRECKLLERQGGVMIFDCDVTFGSSGAPVFSHLNGRGRVMSVISGMTTIDGKRLALGMYLPPLIADLKPLLGRQGLASIAPKAAVRRIKVGSSRSGSSAKFVRP